MAADGNIIRSISTADIGICLRGLPTYDIIGINSKKNIIIIFFLD